MSTINGWTTALDLDCRVTASLTVSSGRVTQMVDQSSNAFTFTSGAGPLAPAADAAGLVALQFNSVALTGPSLGLSGNVNGFMVLNHISLGTDGFPFLFMYGSGGAAGQRVLAIFTQTAASPPRYHNSYNANGGPGVIEPVLGTPIVLAWGFNDGVKYTKMLTKGSSSILTAGNTASAITTPSALTSVLGGGANHTVNIARMAAIAGTMSLSEVDEVMRYLARDHGLLARPAVFDFLSSSVG